MTFSRLAFLLLIAPLSAHAAISTGDGGDGTGGTSGGGTTTPPPPPPTWSKSYTKSALWGSSSWGAGYSMSGKFSATPAHDTYKDQLAASFGLDTYAKLDSGYYPLFAVHTAGSTEAQRKTTASFNAYVGSVAIYSKSYTSTTSTVTMTVPGIDWPVTFLSERVNVDLGPVPVTFTVKASGDLNANITGKISNIGIQASTTPSGGASLYASAAVGGEYCWGDACVGAEAGVYADVKLVTASAPASGSVTWSLSPYGGAQVGYDVNASLDLHSLDGELGVYAKACFVDCWSDSAKLISWTGFHATYPLAAWSGSACFVGTCSLSNGT